MPVLSHARMFAIFLLTYGWLIQSMLRIQKNLPDCLVFLISAGGVCLAATPNDGLAPEARADAVLALYELRDRVSPLALLL